MKSKLAFSVSCSLCLLAAAIAASGGEKSQRPPAQWGVTVPKAIIVDRIPDVKEEEGVRFLLVWAEFQMPKGATSFPTLTIEEDTGRVQPALGLDCEVPIDESPLLYYFSDMRFHGTLPNYGTSSRGEWFPVRDDKGKPKEGEFLCAVNRKDMIVFLLKDASGRPGVSLAGGGRKKLSLVFVFPIRSEAKSFQLALDDGLKVPIPLPPAH